MTTSWVNKRLGDLATVIMGQSPKSEHYNDRGDGLPFFQGNRDFGELHPSPSTYCSKPTKIALPRDILMSVRAPVGSLNLATEECCIGRGLCAIRPNRSGRFIFYLLKANIENIRAVESGAVFGAVNKADLNSLLLYLPSDERTQDEIATILSGYDDLIENNLRRIKILEEMAQTLYREWFVKFRFPGHQKYPPPLGEGKGEGPCRLVNSPLGKIPEGWEVKCLGDFCSILMGQSPKSEFYNTSGEGLPFHQGVTDFGERFPTTRVYCTFAGRIAETGEILFSVRAPVGRLNLTDRKIIIGRGLSAIRNLDGYQYFTFHQLKEIFTEEDIMGGGTIFKAVTKGDMERIECLYPPKEYLVRFEKICLPIAEQLAALGKKNRNLRQTRDLLLPKLISGKLDVSELDIKTANERS